MSNVLYEQLPYVWDDGFREYIINTSFRIGVQLSLLFEDNEITDREREYYMINLMFGDGKGNIREFPENPDKFSECLAWFMNGWYHDNPNPKKDHDEKVIDYVGD